MQTDTAQNIFQKVPMLTEEQQKKILEMADSFLSSDHYIHGTEKH